MSYSLIVGDLEPDMRIDVANGDDPADLTGAADISMRWLKPDGTEVVVPMVAVTLGTGQIKRVWMPGDTDLAGTHRGRIIVTMTGGEVENFPNDGSWLIWHFYE